MEHDGWTGGAGAAHGDGIDERLSRSGDGVDMGIAPRILSSQERYRGAVFHVDDMRIMLRMDDGGGTVIRRQVVRHAPCVVMLVHDVARDAYVLEREYRVGPQEYVYGLPAGLMDEGEEPLEAALRELREETGIMAASQDMDIDMVGAFRPSEGMSDELAHIMVLHLGRWSVGPRRFDADEHVQMAWVGWEELCAMPIVGSNSVIAIQHEALRRIGHTPPCRPCDTE